MKKSLPCCLLLLPMLALADVDDLPPPPGWRSAAPPSKPDKEAPAESGESFTLTDQTEDITQADLTELDIQTLRFVRLDDPKKIQLTLTLVGEMPPAVEDRNYRIYVRLDLDQDASTGLNIDNLGAERTLVLTGDGEGHPWRASQGRHGQTELGPFIMQETVCRGNELILTFRIPDEHLLDQVDISVTATLNHRVIDRIGKTTAGFKVGS